MSDERTTEIVQKIEHELVHGADDERESLLRAILELRGIDEYTRLRAWSSDKRQEVQS